MGLFDFLKPAWMSINEDKALKSAKKETDQTKLAEIAKNAPLVSVRLAVVEKLTDHGLLSDVARYSKYKNVIHAAVSKLIDTSIKPPVKSYYDLEKATYEIAHTPYAWKKAAYEFLFSEINKPSPNFVAFNETLGQFYKAERHAAWLEVGFECKYYKPEFAKRCLIEALYNDPDPASVAWDHLEGTYDKNLRVLYKRVPYTFDTVNVMRDKLGSVFQMPPEVVGTEQN